MNKAFEKIIEKLEERTSFLSDCTKYGNKDAEQQNKSYSTMMMYEVADLVDDLIEIVKQEAEKFGRDTNVGSNGWIPCDGVHFPEENVYVRVTTWTGTEKIGFRRDGKWFVYGSDGMAEATVLAWQPTQPYQLKGE